MMPLNRRDMLQWSAACGLSTAIAEAAFSAQPVAADSSFTSANNEQSPTKTRFFFCEVR